MSGSDSSTIEFDRQLVQHLLSAKPASLTVIGQLAHSDSWVPDEAGENTMIVHFESLQDCQAAAEAAQDAASEGESVALLHLDGNDDLRDNDSLGLKLGDAVRRFPERLVVSIDTPEPADTAFYAFGFRKLQLEHQGTIRLFEYCLSEYKQPPDWLNARYWANPDRFHHDEDPDIYSEDYGDDEE